ncbi:MAG: hypothetical protein ACK58N_03455 [Synechocystis sp.]
MSSLLTLNAVSATDISGLEPLLIQISFSIEAGDRLGIEGPAGAVLFCSLTTGVISTTAL